MSHPVQWHVSTFSMFATVSRPLMFLSNKPLQEPCVTTHEGGADVARCRPRTDLRRDGVLVVWSALARLGSEKRDRFAGVEGDRVNIDGHPAVLVEGKANGWCRAVGGTHQMVAYIDTGRGSDHVVMDECAAHPIATVRAELLASLFSVRL